MVRDAQLRCAPHHEAGREPRTLRLPRYLNVIKSVRLSVEALAFNGSFAAFALF